MGRLAIGHSHRQARNRSFVASARLSLVLDLEKPTSLWPTNGLTRFRALIREMSTANPLWGAPRIHGELLKLGISVSESTVAKYMRQHPRSPSQTWRTFLTDHASQIMAADLFVVPTVTFRLLFVLVILAHDRRQIVHVAVTEHPTAAWTAQQLRNAFPENEVPRYLLHDRDSVFAHVATTLEGMNIQEVRTAPRSPWQNAYAERVIGSIRRECLDHMIVVNTKGLHRVLTDYIAYYLARAHISPRRGHTGHASDLTAVGRTYCRHPRSRRSTPPLRPHRRIAVVRRRPQPQPSSNHLCVEHFCVRWRCCGRSHPRTHRLRAQRGITRLWMGLDLKPYRLLDSHKRSDVQ